MLTPQDLEKTFGLTGGNIFHGAMGLDQLFIGRPAPGHSNYRTPVKGLKLFAETFIKFRPLSLWIKRSPWRWSYGISW